MVESLPPALADRRFDQVLAAAQTIAVYDLGGGTFDISILRLEETESGAVGTSLWRDDHDRNDLRRLASCGKPMQVK